MKKFLKAVKLLGISVTASFAVLAVVYFFETRTIAGGNEYQAVAVDYVATEAQTEEITEEVTEKTTEKVTEEVTEKTTEEVTEEVTEKATEAPTVKETEAQTAAPVQTEAQTAAPVQTEAQTEAPVQTEAQTAAPIQTEAQTEAPVQTEAQTVAAQVKAAPVASTLTDVVYKDGNGTEHKYATLDEAKAAINVPVLSDAEAKAAAKANKTAYAAEATEVVKLINDYRVANGLSKLTVNDTLSTAAMHRAAESAYSDWNMTAMENGAKRHIRPNFQKASSIAEEYGIGGSFGENFGRWFYTVDEIVEGWKASSAHNALLLSGDYTQIGIGIAQDSLGDYYWVALFN